ncbi:MAG: hypothetical protein QGI79_07440, partial [Dehalococcoidia bacterium]|nr:hypothetical protein [Dehalococcoidia bacterium]
MDTCVAILNLHSCFLGQLGTRDTGGIDVYVWETAQPLVESKGNGERLHSSACRSVTGFTWGLP